MMKHHVKNERIKRKYYIYLAEAKRLSEKSIDNAATAIAAFEQSTNKRDFAAFHIEQAKKFKRGLNEAINAKTGKPLAKATIRTRLNDVKAFFHWLAGQAGYKSKISYSDCEYFNQPANDTRIALATREKPVPSIEQIRHVLSSIPSETIIQKRDRALLAFTLLSGMRDDAIASINIGHVDLDKRRIFQDANTVRTKFRKTHNSTFFPVGDDIEAIVSEWIDTLKTELLYSDGDPLFPKTKIGLDENDQFAATGLTRDHWADANSIRKIFKQSFEAANLPYYNPHSFRDTLTGLGLRLCRTPEEFKAWSQNSSHEKVMTTFMNYGKVEGHRQAEIMETVGKQGAARPDGEPDAQTIAAVVLHLTKQVNTDEKGTV